MRLVAQSAVEIANARDVACSLFKLAYAVKERNLPGKRWSKVRGLCLMIAGFWINREKTSILGGCPSLKNRHKCWVKRPLSLGQTPDSLVIESVFI